MLIVPSDLAIKPAYNRQTDGLFADGLERTYMKNQLINYQGDSLSHFYLIRQGYIKAYTILEAGDTRTIMLLNPGDIFPIAFSVSLDWSKYHIKHFYQTLSEVTLTAVDRESFKETIDTDMEKMQAYVT